METRELAETVVNASRVVSAWTDPAADAAEAAESAAVHQSPLIDLYSRLAFVPKWRLPQNHDAVPQQDEPSVAEPKPP